MSQLRYTYNGPDEVPTSLESLKNRIQFFGLELLIHLGDEKIKIFRDATVEKMQLVLEGKETMEDIMVELRSLLADLLGTDRRSYIMPQCRTDRRRRKRHVGEYEREKIHM